MPFSDPTLALERVDDKRWMLLRSLYYQGETDLIIVPAGFKTDLASVPRVLQWFAPSSGQYTLAAVLHDYLCDRMVDGRAYLYDDYCRLPGAARESYITARDADGLFRRVMREEGVPIALRGFMWAGVRWGSVFSPSRRNGTLRDMPKVLLWSLLALPIIAPALVFILIGLGFYYFYEFIAEAFE